MDCMHDTLLACLCKELCWDAATFKLDLNVAFDS